MSVGWLPYDPTHSSVVAYHPLTSLPSDGGSIGYDTVAEFGTSGPEYDSELGMNPNGGGLNCTSPVTAVTDAGDGDGYQISLDIQRDWLCGTGGLFGGYEPSGNEYALRIGSTGNWFFRRSSGANSDLHWRDSSNDARYPWIEMQIYEETVRACRCDVVGKNEFVRFNAWVPGDSAGAAAADTFCALDGLMMSRFARGAAAANAFLDLLVLGAGSNSPSNAMEEHYIRNFQIAAERPTWNISRNLGKVGFLGDSLTDYSALLTGGYEDNQINLVVQKYFQKRGIRLAGMHGEEHAAATLHSDSGASWLGAAGRREDILAQHCDTVWIGTGTNDVTNPTITAAEIAEAYLDHIDYMFGLGSYTSNTWKLRNVLITTIIPKLDGTNASGNVDANAAIRGVIDTFEAANPSYAGRVKLVDWAGIFGNAADGSANAAWYTDNTHMTEYGDHILGTAIAEKLLEWV